MPALGPQAAPHVRAWSRGGGVRQRWLWPRVLGRDCVRHAAHKCSSWAAWQQRPTGVFGVSQARAASSLVTYSQEAIALARRDGQAVILCPRLRVVTSTGALYKCCNHVLPCLPVS